MRRAAYDLAAVGLEFALIGGLAVGARAEARFTGDVDIAVRVADDATFERHIAALRARGYHPETVLEQTHVDRLATVRLRNRAGILVDLLAASSGIEPEIVEGATPVELEPGLTLPVASAEALVAMKVLSLNERRFKDAQDLVSLFEVNLDLDIEEIDRLLGLIEARGFGRQQDLRAKLRDFRAKSGI